jgi:hypothetical protein
MDLFPVDNSVDNCGEKYVGNGARISWLMDAKCSRLMGECWKRKAG